MRPLNLLVIDDQIEAAERLMRILKISDTDSRLGELRVDASILSCEKMEQYDVNSYGVQFDAVLIDFQLNENFTGILVSAWIMLQLRVPRLTLTSAPYPGPTNYFDDFILKNEITDNPTAVIEKIMDCVGKFNYSKWLEQQHAQLVEEYSALLSDEEKRVLYPSEKEHLEQLCIVLDKFEKIIDSEQEKLIKNDMSFLEISKKVTEREREYHDKMATLQAEIDEKIEELLKMFLF